MLCSSADVRSIENGEIEVLLLGYDPGIADKPADELDQQLIPFSHKQGTVTTIALTLTGLVPAGFEVYLTIGGFVGAGDEREMLLWDGLESTALPSHVVMREVP